MAKLPRRRFLHLALGAGASLAAPHIARADAYPTRPVRLIVPFGPGGPTDVFTRLMALRFSEQLGKQFYVENILGGGGNVGTAQAARASPDGHTILVTVSAFVTTPAFTGKAPYDPIKDFAPITIPVASAIALIVHPSLPVATVAELVALIKANPGKYTWASGGVGTQPTLAFERFRHALGLDMIYVPYSGAGPAVAANVAGHVPIGISSLPPAMPQLMEGNLRALAVTSKTRSEKLPNVPTSIEAGYPVLDGDQWVGVLAPAGTPPEIVRMLHREIVGLTMQPDIKERLESLDFYLVDNTPEEFGERIKVELETWRQVVKDANLMPQ
jgi:tripartite-type tricarboxylate transporter receptor subunit TctC